MLSLLLAMNLGVKIEVVHDLLELMNLGHVKDNARKIVHNPGGSIRTCNVTVQMFVQDNNI